MEHSLANENNILSGSERKEIVGCLKDPFTLCEENGALKTLTGTSESYIYLFIYFVKSQKHHGYNPKNMLVTFNNQGPA